jgi:RNA polymerase sigma-70 factor, ECF subfamily
VLRDDQPGVVWHEAAREASVERATDQRERADRFRSLFGDESTFRAWYDAALPRIFGYLFERSGAVRTVAEELTQETFIEAVRVRDRFDGRSDEMTWLVAIARHKLADHYRRLAREERRHLRLIADRRDETTEDPWRSVETQREVFDALSRLPAMQRAVLILHYMDDLPVAEIGVELGKSEGAIESLMSRGRDRFRRLLQTTEVDDG